MIARRELGAPCLSQQDHEIVPTKVAGDPCSSIEADHDDDSRKTENSPIHAEEHRSQVPVACCRLQCIASLIHCMLGSAQAAPKPDAVSASPWKETSDYHRARRLCTSHLFFRIPPNLFFGGRESPLAGLVWCCATSPLYPVFFHAHQWKGAFDGDRP